MPGVHRATDRTFIFNSYGELSVSGQNLNGSGEHHTALLLSGDVFEVESGVEFLMTSHHEVDVLEVRCVSERERGLEPPEQQPIRFNHVALLEHIRRGAEHSATELVLPPHVLPQVLIEGGVEEPTGLTTALRELSRMDDSTGTPVTEAAAAVGVSVRTFNACSQEVSGCHPRRTSSSNGYVVPSTCSYGPIRVCARSQPDAGSAIVRNSQPSSWIAMAFVRRITAAGGVAARVVNCWCCQG